MRWQFAGLDGAVKVDVDTGRRCYYRRGWSGRATKLRVRLVGTFDSLMMLSDPSTSDPKLVESEGERLRSWSLVQLWGTIQIPSQPPPPQNLRDEDPNHLARPRFDLACPAM
jgi:hypothetical protein